MPSDLPAYALAPPRSLYVHIPFCESKCSYCAFNSVGREHTPSGQISAYVDALIRELTELRIHQPLETIYIGGGTPSILDRSSWNRLAEAILRHAPLEAKAEWTVEMNPGTLHDAKLRDYRSVGVTRISLGAQSLDPLILRSLERIHSPEDVFRAVDRIVEEGFPSFNLDLIYGLPGQGLQSFESDLDALLALDPPHLALYNLQFEDGTTLSLQRLGGHVEEEREEVQIAMFTSACERTAAHGLLQYEISNFALPGHRARHNEVYWENAPYFGIGAGAWGCVGGVRYRNVCSADRYIKRIEAGESARDENDVLDRDALFLESLVVMLRHVNGIDKSLMEERFGSGCLDESIPLFQRWIASGWMHRRDGRWALTQAGQLISDSLFLELLP